MDIIILPAPHPSLLSFENFIYEQGKASGILQYLFALDKERTEIDKEFQEILMQAYEKAGIQYPGYWILYLTSKE